MNKQTSLSPMSPDSRVMIRGLSEADAWNHENGFYWFTHPSRIGKLIAHLELYKQIVSIPGDIWELGVYKGASLIRWATFRALLENAHSRKIVGFDAFGKFPIQHLNSETDRAFVQYFENAGGDGLSLSEMELILHKKKFENVTLHAGSVFDTLPAYLKDHPQSRIALLHLDMDVREPTELAMELLFARVVPGGLIVFDDYNVVAGETDAVDSFIAKHGFELEKLPFYSVPAFIRRK